MRIYDVIKFNKYKAYFDVELQKINMEKNIKLQRIIERSQTEIEKINKNSNTGSSREFDKKDFSQPNSPFSLQSLLQRPKG